MKIEQTKYRILTLTAVWLSVCLLLCVHTRLSAKALWDQEGIYAESIQRKVETGTKVSGSESGAQEEYLNKCQLLLDEGTSSLQKRDFTSAQDFFHKALQIAGEIRDSVLMAKVYSHLSFIYTELEVHYTAIGYLNKASEYYKSAGRKDKLSATLYNTGILYSEEKEYDKAVKKLKASLFISDDLSLFEEGLTYSELGAAYTYLGNLDSARVFLDRADSAFSEQEGVFYSKKHLYEAEWMYRSGNPDINSLLDEVNKAIETAHKENNLRSKIEGYRFTAKVLEEMGKPAEALEKLEQAVLSADPSNTPYQKFVMAEKAAKLSEVLGLNKKANNFYKKAMAHAREQMEQDREKSKLLGELQRSQESNMQLKGDLQHMEELNMLSLRRLGFRNRTLVFIAGTGFIFLIMLIYTSVLYFRNRRVLAENKKVLSVAGHDIRTPLAQLHSTLELMEDKVLDRESQQYLLRSIKDGVIRSTSTVEGILGWARAELDNQKSSGSNCKLCDAVEEAVKFNEGLIKEKNLNIEGDINPEDEVYCNKGHLEIILRNLVSNAVKFSDRNGKIELISNSRENETELIVRDHGKGMDEETKKSLFTIIHNKKKTGKHKGEGIGLFLTYQFVKRNKGKIEVESEPGAGSTFKLFFPNPKT